MPKSFEDQLEAVGFLPSESKVYLASLELGPTTVQKIAAKAGISRTAAYDAIALLQERGLISTSMLGKRSVFSVEDPERIVSHLKERQQEFKTRLSDITRSVGDLRMIAGGIRPTVRTYEGDEALHAFFEHVAKVKPKQFLELTNADDIYEHLDEKILVSARKVYGWAHKHNAKMLYKGELKNPRRGVEFRQLGDEWGDFHGNIAIYGDYISMATYIGKVTVVIIESKALADSMRTMFEMAWASAKKN